MEIKQILSNWIVKNILAAVLIFFALVIAASVFLRIYTHHNRLIETPNLTVLSVGEAESLARSKGLRIEVTDSLFVKRFEKGAVYRQDPLPGAKVKSGRKIRLTINAHSSKKVTVPNVVGCSTRQAKALLQASGLRLGRLIYVADMASNNVLRQLRRGTDIRPGKQLDSDTAIDLVVGLGDTDRTTFVPKVVGLNAEAATGVIHDAYLNVKNCVYDDSVHDYADSVSAVVYRQSPSASSGSILMGSEVSIYLTTYPERKAE